jgi:hypothetical protein
MRYRLGLLLSGVLLAVAESTFAQDTSRGELSAGWRYYHVTLSSVVDPIELETPNDYPEGWYADVAVNLSPMFAIVGEAGGTYQSDDMSRTAGALSVSESADLTFHTFMGGVRVRAPQVPWFVPFGQVLFGGERDTSTNERRVTVFQTTSTTNREATSSNPVLGLDAGVTVTAGVIGVRVSVGYVRFFDSADADALRVNLGAAFRF